MNGLSGGKPKGGKEKGGWGTRRRGGGEAFFGVQKRGKPRRRERSVCANTSQMPLFPFRPSRPSVGVVLPAHFSTFTSGQTAKKGGKDVKRKSGVFLTRLPILFPCNGLHYAPLFLRIHRQRLTLRPTVDFLVR